MWSTMPLVHISTCLNRKLSHKWDELCQHDKSVEMGILMQQAEVPEHKDLIYNPNHASIIDLIALATQSVMSLFYIYKFDY